MSDQKHSPAPWFKDGPGIIVDVKGDPVCTFYQQQERGLYSDDLPNREANQHLIQFCPELYEAVQRFVEVAEAHGVVERERDAYHRRVYDAWDKLRYILKQMEEPDDA